jgi:hypothetical protein
MATKIDGIKLQSGDWLWIKDVELEILNEIKKEDLPLHINRKWLCKSVQKEFLRRLKSV